MFGSISETQKAILSGDIKCVDVVDHFLQKIDEKKHLNAFLTVTREQAYDAAKKQDKLVSSYGRAVLERLPLLGVVVSYKDLFLTKGVRTTAGSRVLESYIPTYSATIVERSHTSGMIMIGKTNCDAWAHGASGENSDFGPTLNPHNNEFVPGGSSSGSAVSVAAGLSHVSFGTDTGGSVRQPANFCGIYGLKPTYGAVSRYGVVAMASSLDCVGVFSGYLGDCKKVFDVVRGTDGRDATLKNGGFHIGRKPVIGVPDEYFSEDVDPVVLENVMQALEVFKGGGYKVKRVKLPSTKYAISVYYIVQPAEVSSNLARYDGIRFGESREMFGLEAKRRIVLGTFVLSSGYYDEYYKKASKVRTLIINEFDEAFKSVDVLISPVSPSTPFRIGEKSADPLKMYLSDILTVPANIAGIPALSVPFGRYKEFPLGFQLMGPKFSEEILFEVAGDFERMTDYKFIPV
jgi:aspartyl-tRNA(Asn)/glutamyl-tRNA(Gln) amidotransferase subunit A